MPLSTTYRAGVEAAALAYVRQRVIWFRDTLLFPPHSALSQEAAHALVQAHLRQRALEHPNHMLAIKKKAEQGHRDPQKVLLDLANEYEFRGETKPPPLGDFQMQWNAGLIRKRTRDKTDNCLRNLVVAHLVWELGAFGLDETRRPSQRRHHSRCSILAIALASELPRGMTKPTERAVEKIWEEWQAFAVPSHA